MDAAPHDRSPPSPYIYIFFFVQARIYTSVFSAHLSTQRRTAAVTGLYCIRESAGIYVRHTMRHTALIK